MTTLERPRLSTEERNRVICFIGWIENAQRTFGGLRKAWRRHLSAETSGILDGLAADLERRREELYALRDGYRRDRQPTLLPAAADGREANP